MAGHPVLVFDIGGTNVRGAVCDPGSGRPVETAWRATPNYLDHPGWDAERLFAATLDEMAAVGHELAGSVPPAAVIVGWPGPVAPDGTALRSPTILGPEIDRVLPVGAAATDLWPTSEVATLNDLSAAGYAYVGRGCGDFCVVTVGSGIGNKVFVDGRPLVGPGGRGGEIGHGLAHMPADCPGGAVEPGARLGEVASGRGALRLAGRLARACPEAFADSRLAPSGGDFDERALVGAFLGGDAFARRAVELAAVPLGRALAGLHVGVGTERFVLTGGFATALGERYRRLVAAAARDGCWDVGQDWDGMVEIGSEEDGLVGGGVYAVRELLGRGVRVAA
jgi:predicted NBD/HSP70 family sugar kinase